MGNIDSFQRLEEKVNQAIEHIETLTHENDEMRLANERLSEALNECRRELALVQAENGRLRDRVRDRLNSILSKVNSLREL